MNKLIINQHLKKLMLFAVLIFHSCGTGPWFVKQSLYKIYKGPIYENPTAKIRTNGYYICEHDSLGKFKSNCTVIFNEKGYCKVLSLLDIQDSKETNRLMSNELDWWKIKDDSIIIECYRETTRLMETMVWWYKGTIVNDSTLEIAYHDDHCKYPSKTYHFVHDESVPTLVNNSRYLNKEWYLLNLNEQRK